MELKVIILKIVASEYPIQLLEPYKDAKAKFDSGWLKLSHIDCAW